MESSWRPTTKQVAVLISLDLSAAFDTIDHRLLLDRLQLEFGVMEIPLRWLQSYLEGWTQFIKMGQHKSHATDQMGVPQGPVLGPLSFAVYCSPIADVISHPRRTVSPIRRRHAAPSGHVRQQHTRRAVRSRRVYR